ncbi:MAG: 6-bladed beta-propeller [Gemmatimonadota bacterium]
MRLPGGRPSAVARRLVAGALVIAAGAGCGQGSKPGPVDLRVVGQFEPPGEGYLWAPVDVEVDGDRVWVLDAGAGQAYAYDSRGRYRRAIGRKGHGPGELLDPLALGVAGDTLWVLNTGNARVEYFSKDGRLLGSEPLPDSLPAPVDLVRWQGAFVGALAFGASPLVRFGGKEAPVLFGAELARRAREVAPDGGTVPSVYRLAVLEGELWVAHLYLPLVGVYAAPGRAPRLLEFEAPDVGRSETSLEERAGRKRWVLKAPPRPGGGLGFLHLDGRTYLLTHRRGTDGRQILVWWPDEDAPGQSVPGLPGILAVSAARAGERGYVVGARGDAEEPVVLVVEPGSPPGADDPR